MCPWSFSMYSTDLTVQECSMSGNVRVEFNASIFLRQNFEGIATSRIASTGTLRNNTAQEKQGIYIPHLYSNPFAIHDDCLHFEVDACRYHKKIFCKIRKQSSHDWRHWVSVGYKIIRHKLRCCLYTNLSSIYVIC